eukprot:944372-Rhodomonas_salina.1
MIIRVHSLTVLQQQQHSAGAGAAQAGRRLSTVTFSTASAEEFKFGPKVLCRSVSGYCDCQYTSAPDSIRPSDDDYT